MLSHAHQALVGVAYLAVFVYVYRYSDDLKQSIIKVFNHNPLRGTILYLLFATVGTALFVPVTLFNTIALVLYTPFTAFWFALLAHGLGGGLIFFLTRQYLPENIKNMIRHTKIPLLKQLLNLHGLSNKDWMKLSILTRVAPNFPFALVNYMWGMTDIPVWTNMSGILIGCIPYLILELFMLLHVGKLVTHSHTSTPPFKHLLVVGLTLLVSFGVGEEIHRVLKHMVKH